MLNRQLNHSQSHDWTQRRPTYIRAVHSKRQELHCCLRKKVSVRCWSFLLWCTSCTANWSLPICLNRSFLAAITNHCEICHEAIFPFDWFPVCTHQVLLLMESPHTSGKVPRSCEQGIVYEMKQWRPHQYNQKEMLTTAQMPRPIFLMSSVPESNRCIHSICLRSSKHVSVAVNWWFGEQVRCECVLIWLS